MAATFLALANIFYNALTYGRIDNASPMAGDPSRCLGGLIESKCYISGKNILTRKREKTVLMEMKVKFFSIDSKIYLHCLSIITMLS